MRALLRAPTSTVTLRMRFCFAPTSSSSSQAMMFASVGFVARSSGTEPVIRIMAEGEDAALVGKVVDSIAEALGGQAQ